MLGAVPAAREVIPARAQCFCLLFVPIGDVEPGAVIRGGRSAQLTIQRHDSTITVRYTLNQK